MSLVKRFQSDAGEFSIDDVMQGQSELVWYDPLKQIALQPSLREATILTYKDMDVEGLFAEVNQMLNAGKYMVKTNPHYWTEYSEPTTLVTSLQKATAVGAAGAEVTVALDISSYSKNGKFSVPKKGYRGSIKEINQTVNITSITKTVNGAHTIGLTPINNATLDLTKYSTYTLTTDSLRMYKKGDRNCITGSGIVKNPPIIRKGWIQKWEDMIPIGEDELDGYSYGKEFRLFKGIDPVTGKGIEMWSAVPLLKELEMRLKDSKIYNTMWGERDDVSQTGFNGILPTTETEGSFNRFYDPSDGSSLKAMLWNMIKSLRKIYGCNEYMLLHDAEFGMDWSTAIAQLVKDTEIGKNYQLFGLGGEGQRDITWYQYNAFMAYEFTFTPKKIGVLDSRRYGAKTESYALMMPACRFKDTNGDDVAPVNYTNIYGAESAQQDQTFIDDTRKRGCRDLNCFVKTSYGMEQYGVTKWGSVKKFKC
jgi:hypothetical protein